MSIMKGEARNKIGLIIVLLIIGILTIPVVSAGTIFQSYGNSFTSPAGKTISFPITPYKTTIKPSQSYSLNIISPTKNTNKNFSTNVISLYSFDAAKFTRIPSSFTSGQPQTNWALLVDFDGSVSEAQANEILLSHNIPAGANIYDSGTGPRYYLLIPNKDYYSILGKIQGEKNLTVDLTYQRTVGGDVMVLIEDMNYPESGAIQRLISVGVPLKRINEVFISYTRDMPDTVAKSIQSQLISDNRVLYTKIWYGWWACGVNGCGPSSLNNKGYY